MMNNANAAVKTAWPDTNIDRRAWALAQTALGAGANIHALIDRANQIKAVLKGEAQ